MVDGPLKSAAQSGGVGSASAWPGACTRAAANHTRAAQNCAVDDEKSQENPTRSAPLKDRRGKFRSYTFKTGFQIDDLEGDISQPPQGRGDFNFTGQYTDIPNQNSSLTGLGFPVVLEIGAPIPAMVVGSGNIGTGETAHTAVGGLDLGHAQTANFAPRIGFAYRITPRLVARGGFGTAYGALGNLGYGGTLGTNYPFGYVSTFNSPDSQHPLLLSNGQPATMEQAFATVSLSDPAINSGQGLNLYGRQYNFQTPYVETENLTIQDQFTNHDSIQVAFVGTQGRHLDNLGYNNPPSEILPPSVNPQTYVPFPNFARNATYETTNAVSSYNSLQTTYEHQISYDLYPLANYTWSKCMSDQHTQAEQNQQYRAEWLPGFGISRDYGLCDTDATHLVHVAGSYDLPFGRGPHLHGQRQ